jgi:fatty-acyl-CoA synthase
MLSYAHGVGDAPLLGDTIGAALARTAARFGDRDALVVRSQGYRASWRQLYEDSGVIARGLLARGVAPGDRVGLWSPNRYEWVLVQYAAARIGAVLVNINPAYKATRTGLHLEAGGDHHPPVDRSRQEF